MPSTSSPPRMLTPWGGRIVICFIWALSPVLRIEPNRKLFLLKHFIYFFQLRRIKAGQAMVPLSSYHTTSTVCNHSHSSGKFFYILKYVHVFWTSSPLCKPLYTPQSLIWLEMFSLPQVTGLTEDKFKNECLLSTDSGSQWYKGSDWLLILLACTAWLQDSAAAATYTATFRDVKQSST